MSFIDYVSRVSEVPTIPDDEGFIISDGSKYIFVKSAPRDIFNNVLVMITFKNIICILLI